MKKYFERLKNTKRKKMKIQRVAQTENYYFVFI
jgi:hypothetical protein